MKYFKYVLGLTLVLIGFAVSINKDVEAISINFDFGNLSPRFQYLYDDNDELIPFEFEFFDNFDNPSEVENFNVVVEQVTYDGVFIKNLVNEGTDYTILNSTITAVTETYTAVGLLAHIEYLDISYLDYININAVAVGGTVISVDDWSIDEETNMLTIAPNITTTGDSIIVTYLKENSDTYRYELNYDWSGLQFDDNNIIFYRVKLDQYILFTGAVMRQPQYNLTYDVYGVEFGEFLVEENGLVDFEDQDDFTSHLNTDRYMILHYRIPQALINVYGYKTIVITDIINNTTEETFTTDDILSLQGLSDITNATDFINSFIVIPLDQTISGGLDTSYDIIDERFNVFLNEYTEGSYYIGMVEPATPTTLLDGSSAVWNIMDDEHNPFEFIQTLSDVSLDQLQRLTFYKHSELIYSGYTTTYARDIYKAIDYSSNINETNYTYAASYYPSDVLSVGDNSYTAWYVEPSFMPYSLDPSDFTIEMDDYYTIVDEAGIAGDIDTMRTMWGMSDSNGAIIFSIVIIAAINIIILMKYKSGFIIAITNLVLVSVLSFLGFIPMWFIMGVVLISILGFMYSMSGGVSNE